MVNAIVQNAQRTARSTTSIVRMGWVKSVASGPRMLVTVAGTDTYCSYVKAAASAVVNDQVVILVTGNVWIVIGVVAN